MDFDDFKAAHDRIKPFIATTPILQSHVLQRAFGKNVWLKLETQNPTGSFKPRPAFNSMLTHLQAAKERGVIASSSGNFAQGVAFAASVLNVNAMIVMTESTLAYKIQRTKSWGAEVVLSGDSHAARMALTNELCERTKRVLLHPYNSDETIAGDGTIGLELAAQLGDNLKYAAILVPVSGGGLIAGIAFVLKSLYPSCKIIGIQPSVSATLAKSLQAGSVVTVEKFKTLADALIATAVGEKPFAIIKQYVDDVILIDERDIRSATQFMLDQHKLVVEPAAALPIAALFANAVAEDNIVAITTGGNIDLPLFLNSTESI